MLAKLHCQAVGAPTIRFSWERDGSNIINVSEKYIVEQKQVSINLINFEIFFSIHLQLNTAKTPDDRFTVSYFDELLKYV